MTRGNSSQQVGSGAREAARRQESITIGIDLGDRNSCYCVLGSAGQVYNIQRTFRCSNAGMNSLLVCV